MRSNSLLATISAICVMTLAAQAAAAPLDLANVAANAKWVAHLDLDAVRDSSVVKRAWEKCLAKHPDAEAKLGMMNAMLGMNPLKDVNGVTCYGAKHGKPGITVIAGNLNKDRLLGLTKALPGRETKKHGDREIHAWKKGSKSIAAAFQSDNVLILASSVDEVAAALDVLDGEASALAADGPLGGNIPAGTTFLLRANEIAKADLPCKAPVVKEMQSMRLVVGESEGKSFFRARFQMTNRKTTELGLQAVQGWKAQGNLLCPDELGRKLISALRPKIEDNTLTVLWSASADDVWKAAQQIESVIAKKIARHKKHAAAGGCPLCQSCQSGKCPLCSSHGQDCSCAECKKQQDKKLQGKKQQDKKQAKQPKAISPEEDF